MPDSPSIEKGKPSGDVVERLRNWIWEQREKHDDELIALGPAFDLILNKMEEFAAPAQAEDAGPVARAKAPRAAVSVSGRVNGMGEKDKEGSYAKLSIWWAGAEAEQRADYLISIGAAEVLADEIRGLAPPAARAAGVSEEGTPSSHWRKQGKPDPHAGRYDIERAALTLGYLTDDQLANAVFMTPRDIATLTAAKERIRWLSRSLEAALAAQSPEPEAAPSFQPPLLSFTYRNWRGEVAERNVRPIELRWGGTQYHSESQWLLIAFDADKQAERAFAFNDIVSPAQPDPRIAQDGVEVKKLEWTDPSPPNHDSAYDHMFAESPFGQLSIEWKSWKRHDSFCASADYGFFSAENTLEAAKAAAQADFDQRIRSVLAKTGSGER